MKAWIVGTVVLGLVLGTNARTWTSVDGKTVDAELVRVMDGKAYLRPAGRDKLYPFEISQLSKADQDYIKRTEQEAADELEAKLRKARKVKWHTDFNDALAEAEETGYPIMFVYTAPSWCGWCRVLENNIFEQAEFKDYAKENLVCFVADFSDRNEGDRWKEDNADLVEKYPIRGFPRTYILAPNGRKFGVIGGAEKEWGPQDFITKIENFKKKM